MGSDKPKRAPTRKFTTMDDHSALDHARWSYARLRHLARLITNGETEEAVKMARALTGKDKATHHAMVRIEQGETVLRDSGWVLRFIIEHCGEALVNSGAENYLTMSFRLGESRAAFKRNLYSVTLQREGKLTPHEARMRAEKERDEALTEIKALSAVSAKVIAKLERRYEELTGGSEAFAARLWRALHPDTTEAPPSHEAIIAEVGGIVAEISRLRAENTALAAERDAERAARRDYESCITLETSCIGCARLLSACRTAEERAENAEAALVAAQPALQLEAIRAGRIRCEGCGLIVVGGHLACGCCPRCCVCFALEAPHG